MRRVGDLLWSHREAILIALGALATGSVWYGSSGTPLVSQPAFETTWALFLLAAVIGEMLVVDTPRGRPVPASLAILAALALFGAAPWEVAGVALVAWMLAALALAARGERPEARDAVHRGLLGWALPGLAALGAQVPPALPVGPDGTTFALGAVAAVTLGLLVLPALWQASSTEEAVLLVRARGLVQESAWAGVAIGSSAALVVVAHPFLGVGSLLLLLLPILAVRAGLHHHLGIRRTYDQTIVAMSRLTEVTGHVAEGHGVRVGELAVDVARRLGLSERDVLVVERTAHLHEVGRIATDDPESRAHDREVAHAGGAIVREAGRMDDVAEAIERLREPYRRPGDRTDGSLPVAARIVRTACEFDRLVDAGSETWEAFEELHRAMAYDHDPVVVGALTDAVTGVRAPTGPHRR